MPGRKAEGVGRIVFSWAGGISLVLVLALLWSRGTSALAAEGQAGSLKVSPKVSLGNLGQIIPLQEVPPPEGVAPRQGVAFMADPRGEVLALSPRLILLAEDNGALAATLRLPGILAHQPLASLSPAGSPPLRLELLETAGVAEALALLPRLQGRPGVRLVQPDFAQNVGRTRVAPGEGQGYPQSVRAQFNWQSFDLSAALGLAAAWAPVPGGQPNLGQGVRVALIEAGFDLAHPDLQGLNLVLAADADTGEVWQGPGAVAALLPHNPDQTHGTRVAGLIFARHNGIGIDGLAPRAGLIAIRLESGWTSALITAYRLAAEGGADVVNASWTFPRMPEALAVYLDYLSRSGRHGRGMVLVAAAGNRPERLAAPGTFATYPALTAITATDHGGGPAGSAYGPAVFLAAPGMVRTTGRYFDGYEPLAATSAAAALVSGTVALMLSARPDLTRQEVLSLLAATAQRTPGKDYPGGRSPLLGAGQVHAGRAVAAARRYPASP